MLSALVRLTSAKLRVEPESLCEPFHVYPAPMAKTRLDALLVERGLFESRSRAAAAVMAGEVRLGSGGARAQQPGQLVPGAAPVRADELPRYVSRGGVRRGNAPEARGVEPCGARGPGG